MANRKKTKRSERRKKHFDKQGGLCFYCRRPMTMEVDKTNTCTLDHKVPRSRIRTKKFKDQVDLQKNLVAACYTCNQKKRDRVDFDPNSCLTKKEMAAYVTRSQYSSFPKIAYEFNTRLKYTPCIKYNTITFCGLGF